MQQHPALIDACQNHFQFFQYYKHALNIMPNQGLYINYIHYRSLYYQSQQAQVSQYTHHQ